MGIDPRLYEKYSGRSGDPMARLGSALAQSAERKSQLKGAKETAYSERRLVAGFKVRMWYGIVGSLVVLAVVAWRALS